MDLYKKQRKYYYISFQKKENIILFVGTNTRNEK